MFLVVHARKENPMKKIVCLILAVLLLTVPVYAADVDLDSLTDDELQELQARVNEAVNQRGLNGAAILPRGNYYIGKDIAAGTYVVMDGDLTDDDFTQLMFYDSEEDVQKRKGHDSRLANAGESIRVDLPDGLIMNVDYSPALFMVAPKLPFAPETE